MQEKFVGRIYSGQASMGIEGRETDQFDWHDRNMSRQMSLRQETPGDAGNFFASTKATGGATTKIRGGINISLGFVRY